MKPRAHLICREGALLGIGIEFMLSQERKVMKDPIQMLYKLCDGLRIHQNTIKNKQLHILLTLAATFESSAL